MEGVGVVRFYENGNDESSKELVTNMSAFRHKIIRLFGPTACRMYAAKTLLPQVRQGTFFIWK